MKKVLAISVLGGLSFICSGALAQEFAQPGQVVLGAERLMGLYSDHVNDKSSTTGIETKTNTTTVALLGTPTALDASGPLLPSATPRLALDVFVVPGLSLGGSIVYLTRSGSEEVTGTPSADTPTGSTFLFSPRIGYAAVLTPNFAIWPRAGITYAYYKESVQNPNPATGATTETKLTSDFTDVSVEVMAAVLPVPHVALLIGPYIDLPLGGGQKRVTGGAEAPDHPSLSYLSLGLTAGIAVYF